MTTFLVLVAAGALQDRGIKRHERWALKKLAEAASRSFVREPLSADQYQAADELYRRAAYWHGTGRYQRRDGRQVDVLDMILGARALNPARDPFTKTGPVETISLAIPRLHARAYADMHSDSPAQLNRFIRSQDLASFYLIRPTVRHLIRTACAHPDGLRPGIKVISAAIRKHRVTTVEAWRGARLTTKQVDSMLAFSAGSDIRGNYPILFGIDSRIQPVAAPATIRETREVRVASPITLDHITHVEVERDKVEDVTAAFKAHRIDVPVIPLEEMEQYIARQPILESLLGLPGVAIARDRLSGGGRARLRQRCAECRAAG